MGDDVPGIGKRRLTKGADVEEGLEENEFLVESVEGIYFNELKMMFKVKWKNFPRSANTDECLSSLIGLQIPFKYLTEVNVNVESDVFKIFTGLHKSGFRFHTSDDRFLFCVKKEWLLNAPYNKPHLRVFDSVEQREELLSEYNLRLQRVKGPCTYKVLNDVDLAMPPPFFGVNIMDRKNNPSDELPLFVSGKQMTIHRHNGMWCLRTENELRQGSRLFEMGGKRVESKYAYYHLRDFGELLAVSHFVYLGMDVYFDKESSLDRREVFDAAFCISHSCDPNCKIVWDMLSDRVTVVARRKIEKGEDISLDYFSDNKEKKTMADLIEMVDEKIDCFECTCMTDNCRVVLWSENIPDKSYYEYPKEEKLAQIRPDGYKGVRLNME